MNFSSWLLFCIIYQIQILVPCLKARGVNYCDHPDCSMKKQHILCAAGKTYSPRAYAAGMTPWMRYQMLLLHNRQRDSVAMGLEAGQPSASNMRKMYWDFELEEMAEAWARQCQKRHDDCRNTFAFNVLQNVDVRPVVAKMTAPQLLSDVVGSWFSGSRQVTLETLQSFRLSNCSAPGGCNSHWYTAAAWASTWRIGCSQAICTVNKRTCGKTSQKRSTANESNVSESVFPKQPESIYRNKFASTVGPYRFEAFVSANNYEKSNESPLHRGKLDSSTVKTTQPPSFMAYTVCNYGPAGNIIGFPVYLPGPHCAKCPEGTQCTDETYRGLCAVIGEKS